MIFLITAALSLLSQSCQRARPPQPQAAATSSTDNSPSVERDGMQLIKGGEFLMGTDDGMGYEAPVHQVTVKSFWMIVMRSPSRSLRNSSRPPVTKLKRRASAGPARST
jgi:hypothetical protein